MLGRSEESYDLDSAVSATQLEQQKVTAKWRVCKLPTLSFLILFASGNGFNFTCCNFEFNWKNFHFSSFSLLLSQKNIN